MPSFSYKIQRNGNILARPIVPVGVARADNFPSIQEIENKLRSGGQFDINHEFRTARGLLDTGASGSGITESLAKKIGAKPMIKKKQVHTASRTEMRDVYRVMIQMLWEGDRVVNDGDTGNKKIQKIVRAASGFSLIDAIEFTNRGEGDIEVIIGMDIISRAVMILLGHEGRLVMSF